VYIVNALTSEQDGAHTMAATTNPRTGVVKGKVAKASANIAGPIELQLTISIPDEKVEAQTVCEPPNMVGPPQTGRSFSVTYISIFCRVPSGQQAHSMVSTDFGGQWFALFHQGTFDGYDIYVCSQQTAFTIPPTDSFFATTRSIAEGAANVLIHFTGTFL
jgi:hypothetical protein